MQKKSFDIIEEYTVKYYSFLVFKNEFVQEKSFEGTVIPAHPRNPEFLAIVNRWSLLRRCFYVTKTNIGTLKL